jgi:hypothetical protein
MPYVAKSKSKAAEVGSLTSFRNKEFMDIFNTRVQVLPASHFAVCEQ